MTIKQQKAKQFWGAAEKYFIDISAFDVAFKDNLIELGIEYYKIFNPFIFRPTIDLKSGLLCSKDSLDYFNTFPNSEAIRACKKLHELQFKYNSETDIMQMAKDYKLAKVNN